jgi:hypothetical protein
MISFIRKILKGETAQTNPALRPTARAIHMAPSRKATRIDAPQRAQRAEPVSLETKVEGVIESNGPGKNVLVQNEYQREHTGEHEELSLVDQPTKDSDGFGGIDPYNTGQFDRSRNWDKRFRK